MSHGWIDGVPARERERAARFWFDRVASEAETGEAFERLEQHLLVHGVADPVLALVRDAPAQELAHAQRCLELAAAYDGRPAPSLPVARAKARPPRLPLAIEDRDDLLFSITGLCCINETLAVPIIQHMRERSGPRPLVEFQTLHLRDELAHARIGWAHLGSEAVTVEDRATIGQALPALLEANLDQWRAQLARLPEVGEGHGVPDETSATRVLRSAVHEVVLPGFNLVGVPTPAARQWVLQQSWLT